jgi:hypothetical protein
MHPQLPVLLGALAIGATAAQAQVTPPCASYPIVLVDSTGAPAPVSGSDSNAVASFDVEEVYLSFASLPDGIHRLYVHVTDRLDGIGDEVLSTNDPADRIVDVVKSNGVIDLSLPFTNHLDPSIILPLPNGSEVLRLTPVRSSSGEPCLFKAHMGSVYELSMGFNWPYIVRSNSNDPNCFSAYHYFRIGDATPGSDVKGEVFEDWDRSGTRDSGEGPLAGWEVRLVTAATTTSVLTDANGVYCFPNVSAGAYTLELALLSGYDATSATVASIQVCGCANQDGADFSAARIQRGCEGRTIGFWRNKNGTALITQYGILPTLNGLCLADASDTLPAPPATLGAWRTWLQGANATNMAYMLSAQLAAMHCNVLAGNVDPNCVVNGGSLGPISIAELMRRAVVELCADGYTPVGDPNRARQEALKSALDAANNNTNWL